LKLKSNQKKSLKGVFLIIFNTLAKVQFNYHSIMVKQYHSSS
jgi:hypothetical protein